MASFLLPDFLSHFISSTLSSEPRPGLQPIPESKPLTIEAAICPPLVYYVALLFLAPPPPPAIDSPVLRLLRSVLAVLAGFLFFRLPLAYHVPQSIGLTYQLGLVGLYGGGRVLDAFFISPYLFGHIPRRVCYTHKPRLKELTSEQDVGKSWSHGGDDFDAPSRPSILPPSEASKSLESTSPSSVKLPARRPSLVNRISASDMLENMTNESYTTLLSNMLTGPDPIPVFETATTESGWPNSFLDRASWALELELSMRGVGFTWTTADVRHTRETWLPTVKNRLHSISVHVGPILLVSWAIIKSIYVSYIAPTENNPLITSPFDQVLPVFPHQLLLTAALGAFLMAAFSLGHSLFAIMLSPLAPHPLAFFPPLYTSRIWDIHSVRGFWSYGWHRLFTRLFLVFGVWPGEWLERALIGKSADQPADVGKVLGGFASSAFVHSFSVRGVLGGKWSDATGEAWFFVLNGAAIVIEGYVKIVVRRYRRSKRLEEKVWYDAWIGRVWWISVLLLTGRNFARGWTKSGLVREVAFM